MAQDQLVSDPLAEADAGPAATPAAPVATDDTDDGASSPTGPGANEVPWVDYFPAILYKRPEKLPEVLEEHLEDIAGFLKVKELFKMAAIEQRLHSAYYWNWVRDCNRLFKVNVKHRARLKQIKAKRPVSS